MKTNSLSPLGRLRCAVVLLMIFAGVLLVAAASAPAGTVAYWRFEAGPADTHVAHGAPAGVFASDIPDASGNGNTLSVWDAADAGYTYRTDRPLSFIPGTGATNNFSVQNSGPWPGMFTQTGPAMQTMTPAAFTIEVSFKPETGGWRNLVGRDSQGAAALDTNLAALYLHLTPGNAVAIKFCDVAGYWHEAISADGIVTGFPAGNPAAGQWYHLAAVSDGSLLSLYLHSGSGYTLVAQTDMTSSGSPNTALTAGLGSGGDWVAGTWTVGRGLYAGVHTYRAYGFTDEVRISDAALPPQQFLFSRPAIQVTSTADNGAGSLREALAGAIGGDTINLSVTGTITLTSDQLNVSNSVTILGPGPGALTVTAINSNRVFLVTGANVTISGLTIANAQGAGYGMGVLTGFGIRLALNDCVVTNNFTTLSGAGIFNSAGATLTLNRCTLTGNVATNPGGGGGAVWNESGTLTVNQSTLQGNNANNSLGGGAIVNNGGTVTVNQSTLTENSATASIFNGGGILNAGSLTLSNSIVAGNTAPSNPEISDLNTITALGNNLTNGVPLLAPLGNYGGSTPTMPALPGSPALDGCTGGTSFTTDQRGLTRIVGPFADIGAVESGNPIPSLLVNTAADENDGLGTNAVSLRDALAFAPSGSTIVFAPGLSGATIVLTNGQLNVSNSVTILGPGPGALTVSGNNASRVFDVSGVNVTISGLTIADGQGAGYGMGIKTQGAGNSAIINGCVISNNSTTLNGGGIFNDPGVTMILSNCIVSGNSANGSGGGILNFQGLLTVIESTVSGNSTVGNGGGGGIFNAGGTLALVNSTLNNNSAGYGGGIYNHGPYVGGATVAIVNSTLSGNSASGGGGIANDGAWDGSSATVRINASTLSGNSANDAGIYTDARFGGSATLEIGDTILDAGASGANIFNSDNVGTVTSHGYNLCSDDGGGFLTATGDQTNSNPLLGPLQNNGGPTWTHALLPGSPARDRGKTNAVPGLAWSTDQRGLARVVDNPYRANATGGDGSDIGAFEVQYVLVTSTADNGPGTLRGALAGAIDDDTINLSVTGTITLTTDQLWVSNSVTLLGPGPGALTVTAINSNRVFLVTGTNVTISGLTIANAQGAGYGMGVLTGFGIRLALDDCVVTNNHSTLSGGGIFMSAGATLTVSNCIVSGNSASDSGGGIYNHQGLLTVIESTVSGNSAGFGGGIANWGEPGSAVLSIHASTFSSNSAYAGGGILNWGQSGQATLTIDASTFSANTAGYGGGGIDNNGWYGQATVTVNAGTFSGNSAPHGGAIYSDVFSGIAALEIGDTIFNAGAEGANIVNNYFTGTVTSDGYNLSSDDGGGFLIATGDQTNSNPMLGPLQDNGGPTWTHVLLPGSPALDRGKTNAVPGLAYSTDQRGLARLVDNPYLPDATGGDGSDIGAFEFQGTGGYDTDADGLADFWELAWFGECTYGGTDDFDHDGQNNLFEFVAGLNPTDPASVFSVRVEIVAGEPNQRTIVFTPWVAGRTYIPLFATDPGGAFAPLTGYSGPTTNGTEVSFTDLNATESQKFYRFQISLQ